LQERRQQGIGPDDCSLLSFMLAAQQAAPGGLVTDKHIRDQLMTFMLAGSDTSATTLAFCLFELARRPQALQAVQQEVQQVLEDTPTGDCIMLLLLRGTLLMEW
jgi:cytochrome P450